MALQSLLSWLLKFGLSAKGNKIHSQLPGSAKKDETPPTPPPYQQLPLEWGLPRDRGCDPKDIPVPGFLRRNWYCCPLLGSQAELALTFNTFIHLPQVLGGGVGFYFSWLPNEQLEISVDLVINYPHIMNGILIHSG